MCVHFKFIRWGGLCVGCVRSGGWPVAVLQTDFGESDKEKADQSANYYHLIISSIYSKSKVDKPTAASHP